MKVGNLNDGEDRTGAQLVLIEYKEGNWTPISWQQTRFKKIDDSTLEAESLSLVDGEYVKERIEEAFELKSNSIRMDALTNQHLMQFILLLQLPTRNLEEIYGGLNKIQTKENYRSSLGDQGRNNLQTRCPRRQHQHTIYSECFRQAKVESSRKKRKKRNYN